MFDNTIKPILKNILDLIVAKWTGIRADYGILALIASVAVPLKLLLFYNLIGVSSNFFFVWLITFLLTYFLFASFKNKWIPAVIYFLLSILMFCDITYSSFFNRYLSVNMLGAAGVLGDITESIKEVLKPWFFLILADAALALAALIVNRRGQKKTESEDLDNIEETTETTENIETIEIKENIENEETAQNDETTQNEETRDNEEIIAVTDFEQLLEVDGLESEEAAAPELDKVSNAEPEPETASVRRMTRQERKARRNRKKKVQRWLTGHKKQVAALLILTLLVFNVSGSFMITSLSNQEIYSYHIKDIVGALTGVNMTGTDSDFMYSFTDTYSTEKEGPLFGVAKGKNLIVIQMESLQNLVVNKTYNGQEITPNLNEIINGNTVYFDHYYQQIGSGNTSDAEFATNNSIYGSLSSYTYKLFEDNYFKGLPVLLKEQGYETAVYHAHENREFWNRENAYPSLGFDTYYGGIGGTDKKQYEMTEWMGWGLTDTEFFKQTMPYLKEMMQPFYSFIITLSNHHPYLMLDKYQFIDLLPEDEGTIFGNYLNSAAYTDYAIGQLMEELKAEGIYDNSIIAFYGDHLGLPKSDEAIAESVSRFLGKEYDFDTMMNIPLIITVPGAEQDINQTVSISGGQMDFLPTIAYLMGFESLDTVYLGHNLLTIDSGFVAEQTYMTKGSFFQDDIAYEMSRDGVFENGRAWNIKTGESVPIEDCYEGYMRSMGLINTSDYILENDVLQKIYLENQNASNAFSQKVEMDYPQQVAIAGAPDKNLVGTNSREALNASYVAGYRDIKINVSWTEDKEAVLLSSWSELSKFFDSDQSQEISMEAFNELEMKNNLDSMDSLDLIAWVKDHPDVTIYVQAERSADYFMKCINSYESSITDQFVLEVPGMVEYTGLYPSVLNTEIGQNTVDQLLEFIKLNNVPAVSMTKVAADGKYKELLDEDCICYVYDEENGLIAQRD